MRKMPVRALAMLTALGCAAAGGEGAPPLSATVLAGFDGWFRPGCPMPLRVAVTNRGGAFRGEVDVVVEGVVWRQAVRVGAETTATAEAVAAAHSATASVRVRLRDGTGRERLDESQPLGLREVPEDGTLVVAIASGSGAGGWGAGLAGAARVAPDALPTTAAAYAAVDVIALDGTGEGLGPGVAAALAEWVRCGGRAVFVPAPDELVRPECLLARLGGEAGRQRSATWRVGLGGVHVATAPPPLSFLPTGRRGRRWHRGVAPELYAAFSDAAWSGAVRWRLTGAALAMLVAVVAVALGVPKGWGRWRRAVCVGGAALALAALGWWAVLPATPAALDTAAIVEAIEREPEGHRTDLVCLAGTGGGCATVDLGTAQAVVPAYYAAEDAGGWSGVVIARDADGRCTLTCGVERNVRRCFLAWEGQEPVASGADGEVLVVRGATFAADGGWRPLRTLDRWGAMEQALVRWQAARWLGGRTFRAGWQRRVRPAVRGTGLLETRRHATLVWVEAVGK